MARRFGRWAAAVTAAASTFAGLAIIAAPAAHADASDVVINEIMYHDVDPGALEFLELYNRGADPVDVSGWTISDAALINTPDNRIPAGTTIAPHGFFLIAGDAPAFAARFPSVTPDLFFVPGSNLSNGGETITLVNATNAVIDTVPYDDAVPWPLTPDGGGPSLELVDPFSDNSLGTSWAASTVNQGTPKAQNSVFLAPPPSLQNVSASPSRPSPGQSVTVQATIPPGSSATLTYKVMFGANVAVPFKDDGASVGSANDGTYSGVIPAAGAGQLIRYRIDANVGGTALSYPPAGDSRHYDGVVVTDPSVQSASLPALEWFLDDTSYNRLLRPVCDDVVYTGVITWQGKVYDNSTFRRRGHGSCSDPKPKIEMQLPAGYAIDFSAFASSNAVPFSGPLDEWALQNESYPVPGLGWQNIAALGDPVVGYLPVRSQHNATFFGTGAILEEYDGSWRQRNGYDSWGFYKVEAGGFRTYSTAAQLAASGDFTKKNPDDGNYTDAWQLTQALNQPASATKTAWIWANLDVPEIVEYMAVTVELRHWDSGGKNFYVARDTNGTGRWRIFHWDLDGIFSGGSDTKGDFVIPDTSFNKLYKSMFEVPDIATMYYRRLRALHDRFLVGNGFVNAFDALTVGKDADRVLDRNKWGGVTLASRRNKVVTGVQERRTQIAAHTKPNEIPTSQSPNPNIVINEIQYNPASTSGDEEYLELYNPSTTVAVDVSGWQIKGVGSSDGLWPVPNGTVIPKGGYVVFVSHDAAFRAAYPGNHFVGGQFPGGLSGSGELIQLFDGARLVDEVNYDDADPWPTAPDGTGPSLELKNPTLDNSLATSWAASTNAGTPNAQNTAFGGGGGGGGGVVLDFGATWRYLDTGVDQGTAWRAPTFNDSTWASGPGPLGFRNKGIVTTLSRAQKRTTYYFRTTFNVGTVSGATLSLVRDDGAVVYVNGNEVARSNMPAGVIAFATKASTEVTGAAENAPVTLTVPASAFHTGSNSIAIEVHQIGNTLGDLGMDARLTLS